KRISRRTLAAGAAILVVAGGAGAAYATTQSGAKTRADTPFLTGVANRLHIDPNALLAAMKAEATARVDAAVAAGKIPAAVGAEIKARIAAATLDHPLALVGPGGRGGPAGRHPGLRAIAEAAATYIGITPDQLRTERMSGKSLAQIATAHGKTVTGLETAIYNGAKAELDKAVAANKITADQEQKVLDDLKAHLDDIVNRTGPPGPAGPRH